MDILQELEHIHSLIHKAYYQSSNLKTIVIEQNESNLYFSAELDKLVTGLEKTVLHARYLNEVCYMDIQPLEKTVVDFEKHWSLQTPTGIIEVDENGWLHIQLDTLLPHCKKRPDSLLRDTLSRLLYGYRQNDGKLPYFDRAMLIIDEHCNIKNRRVFDQDNKAWKVIPNILKGLVIPDDDQHSLGIALVSTWADTPACHIYVMDMTDVGAFFSFHSGDCGTYFRR